MRDLSEKGIVKSFLSFDKMITPSIIKFVFYISLIVSVIASLRLIVMGINSYYGGGFIILAGILLLIFSPIIVRVQCELLIIMFKIHESLVEIRKDKHSYNNYDNVE